MRPYYKNGQLIICFKKWKKEIQKFKNYWSAKFIRLTMDHVDEFELYFIPRIVRLDS